MQSGERKPFLGQPLPSCRHRWSEPFKLDGDTVDYCMRCGARRTRLTLEPYRQRQQALLAAGAFGPSLYKETPPVAEPGEG